MGTHSMMPTHYPKSLRIASSLRVVRRLVLAILPTLIAAPMLLADTAPSFNSAKSVTFPQGVRDTFTITTYHYRYSGSEDYLERQAARQREICR